MTRGETPRPPAAAARGAVAVIVQYYIITDDVTEPHILTAVNLKITVVLFTLKVCLYYRLVASRFNPYSIKRTSLVNVTCYLS